MGSSGTLSNPRATGGWTRVKSKGVFVSLGVGEANPGVESLTAAAAAAEAAAAAAPAAVAGRRQHRLTMYARGPHSTSTSAGTLLHACDVESSRLYIYHSRLALAV